MFNFCIPYYGSGILIGLYLVLLAPCIDYVIVFTALGKGNAQYMLMSTPILLILQIIFLPIYLTLFLNHITIPSIALQPFLHTFITYILIPLILALILQRMSTKNTKAQKWLHITNWFPEIIMALVLFVIVSSQIHKITSHLATIYMIIPIYIIYLLLAPLLGYLSGKLFNLEINTKRTLAFSSEPEMHLWSYQ